ncbi:MAG: MarR family winged helix-turn-helix transcriptional regulator [Candidatus Rifleibacteriota bacterium]
MNTHFVGTEKEKLVLDTFIKFSRAYNAINSYVNKTIFANNLTESQFGVLEALYHLGSMSQKDIAAKLLKSGGNITMVIENLRKRGLINKIRNKKDRRFYSVSLTDAGKQLVRKILPGHVELICQRLSVFNDDELKLLGSLSKKLGLKQNNQIRRKL